MQDWNYLHTNCFEVTIELGCVKYPVAKELPTYWEQNRRSLLSFIQQVFKPSKHSPNFSHRSAVVDRLVFLCLCRSITA